MTHRNEGWSQVVGAALVACGLLMTGLSGCTVYVEPAPTAEYQNPPPAPPPPPVVVAPAPEPAPYEPPPPDVVTVYHGDLDPYGHWVDVAPYGACWIPNFAPVGWAPYTVGRWVYSDVGWTWVSADEEANWGPVVYHYGSWYDAPGVGWCWVPGVTWAPAWVAWREGGGYMCWAPLPPQVVFGGVFGVEVVNRYVPADQYVMVDERYADDPNVHDHIVRNNVTIINRTTNITNITIVNGRAENRGVAVENVERVTGRQVARVEVTKAQTPEDARRLAAEGRPVVYAPAVVEQAEQKRAEAQEQRDATAADEKAKADQEKADRQKADQEKADQEKAQREQAAADEKAKADQEKAQREQAAADEKAKADQEKAQREQVAADAKAKADQEQAEREKAAADLKAKQEQEEADRQQAAQEKADQAKAAREQAEADAKAKQEQQRGDQPEPKPKQPQPKAPPAKNPNPPKQPAQVQQQQQ
jgi:hypothetical protein